MLINRLEQVSEDNSSNNNKKLYCLAIDGNRQYYKEIVLGEETFGLISGSLFFV